MVKCLGWTATTSSKSNSHRGISVASAGAAAAGCCCLATAHHATRSCHPLSSYSLQGPEPAHKAQQASLSGQPTSLTCNCYLLIDCPGTQLCFLASSLHVPLLASAASSLHMPLLNSACTTCCCVCDNVCVCVSHSPLCWLAEPDRTSSARWTSQEKVCVFRPARWARWRRCCHSWTRMEWTSPSAASTSDLFTRGYVSTTARMPAVFRAELLIC
jgi:hypothetical protein